MDLLAVQGTLKSLLQHHSSKASILWRSAFFMVQLSHPYITMGKTIALTRRTFVGKVMSLLFNMLPRLVISFFPRTMHLLISRLQSPSAVILEPKKIKSLTVSIVFPSICIEEFINIMSYHLTPARMAITTITKKTIRVGEVVEKLEPLCTTNNTTLMAESKEELKSLLMKVKEESEKVVLKINVQKTNIMASGPSPHGK